MSPVRPASEWPSWAGGQTRVLPTLLSWLLLQQPTPADQGNPSDHLPSVSCPPNQRLPAGQGRDPPKSQIPGHPSPTRVEHLSGSHPERSQVGRLPSPPQTGRAGLGSGGGASQQSAVLASQGKPGPKGSDRGQEEEGAYLVFSLEMRGSLVMGLRGQERSSKILSHQNFLNTPPKRD